VPDEIIFWVLKELKTRKMNYSQFLQVRIESVLDPTIVYYWCPAIWE
jgi:hypothetical protein